MFFKKYCCVKQHDMTDCAAACLATIIRQYGRVESIAKIRDLAGTDKKGTSGLGLIEAGKTLGLEIKGVKGGREAFFGDFSLPAIAHVVVKNNTSHYIVIHEIDKLKDKIVVADPATGLKTYTSKDFFEIWTGFLFIVQTTDGFKRLSSKNAWYRKKAATLKAYKKDISLIVGISFLYVILGLFSTIALQYVFDIYIPQKLSRSIHIFGISIILIYIFQHLMNFTRTQLLLRLGRKIDTDILISFYNHLVELPLNFFDKREIGDIVSRFNDGYKIRVAISSMILSVVVDSVIAILGAVILIGYNINLFIVSLIMLILYTATVFLFNKPTKIAQTKMMENNSILSSYLVETISGIETIKATCSERVFKKRLKFKFEEYMETVYKCGVLNNTRSFITELISAIGSIMIIWIGAIKVLNGELTLGQLVVFNSLTLYFIGPVKNIANLQPIIQEAKVALERIEDIFRMDREPYQIENSKTLKGDIVFQNVSFKYGLRNQVLNNISFIIKEGEKVAIVGKSGSGKTTIAKLLLRFYEPENGMILVADKPILDVGLNTIRDKIAYVSQESYLFRDSVHNNIALSTQEYNRATIEKSAKISMAHEFVERMPFGYDSLIEENGSNLSAGQRQKLTIARAITKNTDILVFDEATANLDVLSEKVLDREMKSYLRNKTVIFIAHKLETIKHCDKIIVLNNGNVAEIGKHEELIHKKGLYYEMVNKQNAF